MVEMTPRQLPSGSVALGVAVALPKTNLLSWSTEYGYIMCGALDVQLLNDKLAERKIVAGRALGVRTLDDLWSAPLAEVTDHARELGIEPGMPGYLALERMVTQTSTT